MKYIISFVAQYLHLMVIACISAKLFSIHFTMTFNGDFCVAGKTQFSILSETGGMFFSKLLGF